MASKEEGFCLLIIMTLNGIVFDSSPLERGNVDRGSVSGRPESGTAKGNAVNQVSAIVGDLVATGQQTALSVTGDEGSDTAGLEVSRGTTKRLSCNSQDFFLVLEDVGHLLEMQAFKGITLLVTELDHVIFKAPFVALEGDDVVDLVDEVGNGWVVLQRDVVDDSDLGEGVTPDDEAQTKAVVLHVAVAVWYLWIRCKIEWYDIEDELNGWLCDVCRLVRDLFRWTAVALVVVGNFAIVEVPGDLSPR